jgi:hypothetical protein
MDSKNNKTIKLKSSLSQTRKVIAEKFRKLHMDKISSDRKLRKKYAPLTESVQSLKDSLQQKNANKTTPNNQQNLNDDDSEQEIEMDDYIGMPPPDYPPPPNPPPPIPPRPNQGRQPLRRKNQNIGQIPPIPPRPRSRSPHLPSSSTSRSREISRRFSLPQAVASQSNLAIKRERTTTSSSEEADVFNPTRYKSEPKLRRLFYDPIDYDDFDGDNKKNEQIESENQRAESEDGAWGGIRDRALSSDNMYVEIIKPSTSRSTEFIANSLNINKKNRRPTSVLPHVQFGKLSTKRMHGKQNDVDDEVDSDVDILKTFRQLSEKKIEGVNNGEWTDNDEKKYKAIVAILSPDDFGEDGKFIGSGEKRRKVVVALAKFNKETIQKIKTREKSKDRQKKGRGLEKNFIPYSENIVYEYWDDPNELCERLQLLLASKSAGNTNHDQEINSIIEELKERNIIT